MVPSMRLADRTSEEMLRDNFTFKAVNFEWFYGRKKDLERVPTMHGEIGPGRKSKIVEWQKTLADRVVPFMEPVPFNWHSYVEEFSEGKAKVVVLRSRTIESYKLMPEQVGVDMVIGKEQFFSVPFWWSFRYVERGCLLEKSLELLKQAGLVLYFLKIHDTKRQRETADEAVVHFRRSCKRVEHKQESLEAGSRTTMMDSLASESFVLLLYGTLLATAGFAGELITKLLSQWASRIVEITELGWVTLIMGFNLLREFHRI